MNPQISEMLPPSTIGIPTTSSPSDKSESENSYNDGNDDVVITLFNRFDQGSTDKSSTMKSIPEASIADDSFYQRIDDKEFKVESVNELDGSVYFKVQALTFQEDYSKEQLLGYIDQLSSTLKRAEKSVRKQKSRRQSREQTIVKMAKVLKGQNDTLEHLKTRIDEVGRVSNVLLLCHITKSFAKRDIIPYFLVEIGNTHERGRKFTIRSKAPKHHERLEER